MKRTCARCRGRTVVTGTRVLGRGIRRYRRCQDCGARYRTLEREEVVYGPGEMPEGSVLMQVGRGWVRAYWQKGWRVNGKLVEGGPWRYDPLTVETP
jgi:hypothetical protein